MRMKPPDSHTLEPTAPVVMNLTSQMPKVAERVKGARKCEATSSSNEAVPATRSESNA